MTYGRLYKPSPTVDEAAMELVRITAQEARKLVDQEGYALLDVRSTSEFAGEHAAGAYNIPFLHKQPQGMVSNPDFAKVVEAAFPDKSARIVTTGAMGGRSSRAAQQLMAMGYTQVVDLRGGFEGERDDRGDVVLAGWKGSGLPTETGESRGRAYVELYAKLTAPKSVPPAVAAPPAPPATAEAGHAHAHGGHAHGGGHGHGAPAAPAGPNRFADAVRTVACIKLGKTLPGLKRRPMGGPMGERIHQTISADAWVLWVEHSKLLINEYRLNPSEPAAQEMLLKQCEAFLFGEGAADKPKEFKPA
jgi:Fe-S cluster biosynthesis and repair protein YggX/rhodanese-related sulfurtransferase